MIKRILYLIFTIVVIAAAGNDALASYPSTSIHTISVGGAPTSITMANGYLFVANSFDNTVSVIETDTYTVEETIEVGENPIHVLADTDGENVLVTNYDDDSISVISTSSLTVSSTITDVGDGPHAMCLSKNSDKLYVACKEAGSVSIISLDSYKRTKEITEIGTSPSYLALSSSGDTLYVTLADDSSIAIIDLATNELSDTKIAVGSSPQDITFTPNQSYLYTANSLSNSLSAISVSTKRVVSTISDAGNGAREIVILKNEEYALVTNSSGTTISVINILSNTVDSSITVESNPYGIIASDDGKLAYVTNKGSNSVTVLEDQSVVQIDSVDTHHLNDESTAKITWHASESGAYQVEVGGSGVKGTGTKISFGNVTADESVETAIIAADDFALGEGSYKVYIFLTVSGTTTHGNSTTLILDNTPPAAPLGVTSDFGDGSIHISWDESLESDLSGYKVYYGTSSKNYTDTIDTGIVDSYTITGLTNETKYFITVTAVDLAGNESVRSAEVSETPNLIFGLMGTKDEGGCFIATASYDNTNSTHNNIIETMISFIQRMGN